MTTAASRFQDWEAEHVQVALKIWRYNSKTGERALKEYELDAPEEATLLDCLDLVKEKQDGTLAFRKSCRMMICGSCGMRMDGAAVLACKTRMYDIAQAGLVPTISAMGNLPVVKDLVVDIEPFLQKVKAMKAYLQPGVERPEEAREMVRALVRADWLVARDRAGAEVAGGRLVGEADEVRDESHQAQQGGALVPAARREGRQRGAQPPQARPRAGSRRRARPGAG